MGPRQVGKTTLIKEYLKRTKEKTLYVTGDDIRIRDALSSENLDIIMELCDGYNIVAIDEASRIPNIGNNLKLMIDNIENIQIIASSSSSFELAGQLGEPLTGRKITIFLYPISFLELMELHTVHELKNSVLRKVLIYGAYPEIISEESIAGKKDLLHELVNSYLLKDVLEFERVKSSRVVMDLLRLLAYQIGSEVSMNELGSSLKIDHKTVARYLDILEKAYIIFNLRPFSSNKRKEIAKKSKYFFYDLGIRNAIISEYSPIEQRNDTGALFENFVIVERMKYNAYMKNHYNAFFWRTSNNNEVDLVEEHSGTITGYEIKYGRNAKSKHKNKFLEYYNNADFKLISADNFTDIII